MIGGARRKGSVELRFGVLGALVFDREGDPEDARREIAEGPVRADLEELSIAISRALEDEVRRHDGRIASMVLAYGDEHIALIGGRGGR